MLQLLGEKRKFQDRPRDEMRKHGNEAGEINEVRHRFRFAAINIDRVAERLERVEADPEREHDAKESVELREAERGRERVVVLDPEVEVFEKTERREIEEDRDEDGVALGARARRAAGELGHRLMQHAPEFPGVVCDDQTHQPIDEGGREHERHEARLGPTVKGVAGQDEPEIPPALRRAREQVIAEERERQEVINKNVRAKNHGRWIARSAAR